MKKHTSRGKAVDKAQASRRSKPAAVAAEKPPVSSNNPPVSQENQKPPSKLTQDDRAYQKNDLRGPRRPLTNKEVEEEVAKLNFTPSPDAIRWARERYHKSVIEHPSLGELISLHTDTRDVFKRYGLIGHKNGTGRYGFSQEAFDRLMTEEKKTDTERFEDAMRKMDETGEKYNFDPKAKRKIWDLCVTRGKLSTENFRAKLREDPYFDYLHEHKASDVAEQPCEVISSDLVGRRSSIVAADAKLNSLGTKTLTTKDLMRLAIFERDRGRDRPTTRVLAAEQRLASRPRDIGESTSSADPLSGAKVTSALQKMGHVNKETGKSHSDRPITEQHQNNFFEMFIGELEEMTKRFEIPLPPKAKDWKYQITGVPDDDPLMMSIRAERKEYWAGRPSVGKGAAAGLLEHLKPAKPTDVDT